MPARVEGEERGRGRRRKARRQSEQARGGDLNGVEEHAGRENRTFGSGRTVGRDGDQDAGDQVI